MANLQGYELTVTGRALLAKAGTGACTLNFTKVKLGADETSLNDLINKTDLVGTNIKQIDIVGSKANEATFTIIATVTNSGMQNNFLIRQVGIFAKGVAATNPGTGVTPEDINETLFAVAYDTQPDIIPAESITPYTRQFNANMTVTNVEQCNVTLTPSGVVTVQVLNNHNDNSEAHGNLIKRIFGSTSATMDSIKNKINDWAKEVCLPLSGGELTGDITANNIYANNNVLVFNSVAEMKASNKVKAGYTLKTLGFNTVGDGGNADYIVVNNADEETAVIPLQNSLYALMIKPNLTINFKQVGGKAGEGENNNSELLQNLINNLYKKKGRIIFDDTFYFYTPIWCEKITAITFMGTSVYTDTPNMIYMGDGYLLNCDRMHSVLFKNLIFKGNEENYGLSTGQSNSYNIWYVDSTFSNFKGSLNINTSAYTYIVGCNFMASNDCDFLLKLGNSDVKTNMEGVYVRDCKFNAADFYACDLIKIHNVAVARFFNCDFANTSKNWIYLHNTVGKLYRIEFQQCSFTRAKQGIGIKMPISNSLQFLTIKDCGFSLAGEWEDGENKIIYVEDNNIGDIRGIRIENITIQQLSTTFIPEYFFYGGNMNNVFDVDISFKRPLNTPINKFKVTGIIPDDSKIPVTAEPSIKNYTIELTKTFNNVIISGSFTVNTDIQSYQKIFSINQTLFYLVKNNINFIAYTADGVLYPLYIEGNICKTRKTIPINTTVYFYSMAYAI